MKAIIIHSALNRIQNKLISMNPASISSQGQLVYLTKFCSVSKYESKQQNRLIKVNISW